MNYIIFDLEATCWDRNTGENPGAINETIEIGAVLINDQAEIISEFVEFIQPRLNPVLSDFCKTLTTITQDDVDEADAFPAVSARFIEWISQGDQPYVLCSWGFYDKKQLKKDCALHGLDDAWASPHISVKHQYADIKQLRRPVGMAKALSMESLALEGTHHRGIDDARNIAKVFLANWGKWVFS